MTENTLARIRFYLIVLAFTMTLLACATFRSPGDPAPTRIPSITPSETVLPVYTPDETPVFPIRSTPTPPFG